ncbi:MAG: ABC transporter ATP-binding protein [Actinobacteria bacterium]|nr:ABC transporter ATP-binding protein [Actinomycetota bacterium]
MNAIASAASAVDERRPALNLRAVSISRTFAGLVALSDVDLDIGRNEVVGLIGPNGAGKSTLVNILTGFDQPTDGRIRLDDEDITAVAAHNRVRMGIARTFQHARTFRGLSVRENIEVSALGAGATPGQAAKRADNLLRLLDLSDVAELLAHALPHGEEQKLGVARALATHPSFVLLDEPAAGLDEAEIPAFAEVVRTVREVQEAGVLLIEHNFDLIVQVCDRIHVLEEGRTLAVGSPDEIRRHPEVVAAYLGTIPSGVAGG